MCAYQGGKDFAASLKTWGRVLIHISKMDSHHPLSAILLSFNSFLSRYSISFVLEILHSHGIYSKSHYLAAARFLA